MSNLCASVLRAKYKKMCVLVFLVIASILLSTCVVVVFLSSVSSPPVLGVMSVWNVYCLIGSLLTLCRLWLPIELIFWVMNCVSYISGGVYVLLHYYKTEVPYVFLACQKQFNFRCRIASCICIMMGVLSSCGIGLPLVLALTSSRRSCLYLLVMKYAFTIPYISMPLTEQPTKQMHMTNDCDPGISKTRTTLKRKRNVGKENACQGENIPPPKRGRKSKSMDDEHRCGSCTVWLQTGSNEKLLKYHNMNKGKVRHPGDKSVEFSIFLSCNGAHDINLRSDSCMCDACYRDCLRGEGKPRWVGLSKYLICKHCFLCCLGDSCSCECITEWGPTQHLDDSELQLWLNYFQGPSDTVKVNENKEYHICKADKAYMHKVITNRACTICEGNSSPKWVLGKTLLDELGPLKEDSEVTHTK